MKNKLHINQIKNRQYILSPAVQSGNDRECINKDFYQEGDNSSVSLGKLGLGMKVVHRKTTTPYTIIHLEKERIAKFKLTKKINSTLDLMYKSSHPYLFRLLNHYETETHVFMIFEEYDGDSLEEIIMKGRCDLDNSLKYLVEIMLGVQHMHNFRLYNLNVNPENVLITECVKLTDYGLKMEGKNQKPKRTNILLKKDNINYIINAYTSPEELNAILNKKPCILNGKTDSWNCGILLYEMLTKFESPFKGKNNEEFIKAILNCEIDLEPIKDEFCRDLISKLVRKNPKDRIDIDKVLEMDYIINNVLIEQPEIDFSDNIINPIDEQEFLNAMNNSNNNQNKPQPDTKNAPNPVKTPSESPNKNQHLNKELTNLKSENDNLKQLVEDLRKQVVSSGRKKRASKHVSKLKSMVIDVGSEIIADQNIQGEPQEKEENNDGANLDDILNEEEDTQKQEEKKPEKKIEELKKSMKHEIIEEEEDDDEEDFSDKEEEFNDENLFVRCEKYKERNNQLKERLQKISRKNKKLKAIENDYKKEIEQLKNEKNKNILETLEKINTIPIYEINDLVNVILNSINIFKNTQNDIKSSVDKLVTISETQNEKLKEENKKYLDNKTKLFFDIMNNKVSEKEALDELNKPEIKNENENKSNLNNANNNQTSAKNLDYKEKYEEVKRNEELLNAKIKILEENVKTAEELKEVTIKDHQELSVQFQQFVQKSSMAETKIQDLKRFINDNVDSEKAKRLFKDLHIN
jgi:hypothetical protein